jgi:hypothetical protein
MVDINKEAEEYAKKQCDDIYNHIGLTGAEWGWETKLDFIAGHNSKATQAKVIQGQIEIIDFVNRLKYCYNYDLHAQQEKIGEKFAYLQQQLEQLENG